MEDSGKKALDTALRCLSRRQMTVFKLQQRLQEKGFSPEDIDNTVNRLIEWKYLDDQSYAALYIKNKKDKLSKKKVIMELQKAGIDKEITLNFLADIYPDREEFENCRQLAEKLWEEEARKWERKIKHNPQKAGIPQEVMLRKRVGDKLLHRGFQLSTVKAALNLAAKRENN